MFSLVDTDLDNPDLELRIPEFAIHKAIGKALAEAGKGGGPHGPHCQCHRRDVQALDRQVHAALAVFVVGHGGASFLDLSERSSIEALADTATFIADELHPVALATPIAVGITAAKTVYPHLSDLQARYFAWSVRLASARAQVARDVGRVPLILGLKGKWPHEAEEKAVMSPGDVTGCAFAATALLLAAAEVYRLACWRRMSIAERDGVKQLYVDLDGPMGRA